MIFKNYFWFRYFYTNDKISSNSKIVIFFLFLYIFVFLSNWKDGSLFLQNEGQLGLINDFANYFYLLSFLISCITVRTIGYKFVDIFEAKNSKGKIFNYLKMDNKFLEKYNMLYTKWRTIIFIEQKFARLIFYFVQVAILLFVYYFSTSLHVYETDKIDNWNFSYGLFPYSFWANQIKDYIIYAVLVPPMVWVLITSAWATISLSKLIDKEERLIIRPLSPDGVGGLKDLGNLSLLFFYTIIIHFSHLFATSLIRGISLEHQVLYFLLLITSIFVFIFPLRSVKKSMRTAKNNELANILNSFDLLYKRDKGSEMDYYDSILTLNELYRIAKKMPVWPYNFETVVRFSTVFLIPFLVFLLQMLFDTGSIFYQWELIAKLFGN